MRQLPISAHITAFVRYPLQYNTATVASQEFWAHMQTVTRSILTLYYYLKL
jgi:hypothetical protein